MQLVKSYGELSRVQEISMYVGKSSKSKLANTPRICKMHIHNRHNTTFTTNSALGLEGIWPTVKYDEKLPGSCTYL